MTSQPVTFAGPSGRRLAGRLELPIDGGTTAHAILAHCFTGPADTSAAIEISRALCRAGIAVLRLDLVGPGGAEEEGAGSSVCTGADDVVAAAEYLAAHHSPVAVLVGHSLGGVAVLRAAERIESAVAIATIGAPAEPAAVQPFLREPCDRTRSGTEAELAGRRFRIGDALLDDLQAPGLERAIRALRRPLLVLHAPRDSVVGVHNAATIFQAAMHPRSFVALDQADHLLGDARDARFAGGLIAAWAARYIEAPVAGTVEELLAERGVAARTGRQGYRTEVRLRQHALLVDEPAAVGGTDTGPTPYELLAAALGACTSITLRMYADRKGWPLEEVTVQLRHGRVHALDEEQCENRAPRVDRIDRMLEIVGPLSEEQRARLLEIADRCPVHRTLDAGVRIHTTAAPPAPDPAT